MAGDEGKTSGDEGPAKGWDLWKRRWIAEPPETLAAAVEVLVGIIFLVVLASGVVALFKLLAPISILALLWHFFEESSVFGIPGTRVA